MLDHDLGITLHYISEEDKIEKVVLDLVYFPPPHTGYEISLLVKNIFQEWDPKVPIIVTDNGRNMVKAFKQAHSNHVQDVIESVVANNTERNGETEAVHEENLFSDSSDVEADFESENDPSFNEDTGREYSTLEVMSPITQRNSNSLDVSDDDTHLDISENTSEIEIENEEVEFLQFERQASEYMRTIFPRNGGENVLQPFAAYSQLVSADKYVNFSSAVSCIEELKLHLQKSAESPGLNGIACAMLADLSKGFDFMTEKDDPDFDFTYLLATCLNCNYRIFVIEKPDVLKLVLNNIEKIAKQLGLQYYTNKVQSNDPDANLIVSPSFEETQANHDSNGYENLNVAHFSYCWRKRRPLGIADNNNHATDYWKENAERFPFLKNLAYNILAIPVSSAAAEREFSVSGLHSLALTKKPKPDFSLSKVQNSAPVAWIDSDTGIIREAILGFREVEGEHSVANIFQVAGTSAVRGTLSTMAAIFAQKRVTLATKLVAVEMVEETIIFMAMEATVQDMVAEEEQTAFEMAGIRNFSQLTDLDALITATGAISPTTIKGFISSLFVIPKNTRGFRPIINLNQLNTFVVYRHFKMEGFSNLKHLVPQNDWMGKLDLKVAYLTMLVHKDCRRFLQFIWEGLIYQFNCLAFGLSSAPWAFTKILKPVVTLLRQQGIRLIVYLDGIIFLNSDREKLVEHIDRVKNLFELLGFVINEEKYRTTPTQLIEFSGIPGRHKRDDLFLPISKRHFLIALCEKLLSSKLVSLRDLASLLGNFSWSSSSVPYAQSHYRGVQSLYISKLKFFKGIMKTKLELNEEARNDLQWWVSNLLAAKGRAIYDPSPILVIYSNASFFGWGSECNGISTGGPWIPIDQGKHINDLELKAAFFALRFFTEFNRDCTIALKLNNSTAVCYVNRLGGSRSKSLNSIALSIVKWCEERNITLVASHLPGMLNVVVDRESRRKPEWGDWKLSPEMFLKIAQRWILQVDVFAASWNAQLPTFGYATPPPLLPDQRLPIESQAGESGTGSSLPLLAEPGVVSVITRDGVRHSPGVQSPTTRISFPSGRASSAMPDEVIPTDRLEIFRGRLRKQAIPERVIPLVLSGSRPTTLAAYQSALIHWKNWCVKFGHNPEHNNIGNILLFLTEALEAGKAFSSINIYRSMLSVTLQPIEGHAVGKHPYVIALMRGIYNAKPPTPKYSEKLEVEVVLNHLKSSQNIGLKLKAHYDGALHVISIKRLPDIFIDPVACLNHYISVTAPMRNNSNSSKLFVASVKPHKPVGGSTISGWIKKELSEAGIYMSKFFAYFTRGAAASKAAVAGHPIQSILNAAQRASQSTFTNYYRLEVETLPTVAETVFSLSGET
ncbi:Uncharacterized protein APZ42_031346 [Daphnia magna]|uniref:Reverse transcriptase domain-containing protein n=1 Tax=Daphnia magna TaxID=35525 RepID=A0A164MX69_9CRUS|nr:Uncharacterized protein APZ42_031346 [Daphnia magna]